MTAKPPIYSGPDTASLAYSGRDVEYINGYERGHEAGWETAIEAMRHVLPKSAARGQAADAAGERTLDAVYVMLGIGSAAREPNILFVNLQNLRRRSDCLKAVEREFFTIATPPDPDEDDDEPGEECLLQWGADPKEYVEQFRAALVQLRSSPPAGERGDTETDSVHATSRSGQPSTVSEAAWQPIETAPKGSYVLLWGEFEIGDPVVVQGCWFNSGIENGWIDLNGEVINATHWMSLPKPPEATK